MQELLYGKSTIDRIVGLEVVDDKTLLYRLKEDLSIEIIEQPFRYWLLSNQKFDRKCVRLDGDLHYHWGRQFVNRAEYYAVRNAVKHIDSYTIWDAKESCMVKDGYTFYKGLKPSDVPILSFDIETTGLDPNTPTSRILLISNTFRKAGKIKRRLFAYDDFSTEGEMIQSWVDWVNEVDPSIICGHNIFGFDFPYILHRAELSGIQVLLGRDGSRVLRADRVSEFRVDGSRDLHYQKIRCHGRELIDTMFLAYRYDIATKKYDSYGLKSIIKTEGLEKNDRVFYDASQIRINYTIPEEWKKIKEYCEHDADDSLALFDLMCPPYFYMSQSIPRTFQQVHESATGAQINGILVRSYLQKKHSIPKATEVKPFPGAISIGIPGIYNNPIRWDVASLYPSIILTYNIYDKNKDPEMNFLKMMRSLTEERLRNKKIAKDTGDKYYKDLEASQKVLINSGYGFMSAPGLNFNSPENAALVTKYGRDILTTALKWSTGVSDEEIVRLLDHQF